jgi:hypothetical protein
LFLLADAASAVDQPIAGTLLKLKSTADGARLVFRSRDPAVPFPPIGSLDDPATGTPGGMIVEIFSQNEAPTSSSAPSGTGDPGWTMIDGAVDAYVFRGPGAPIRRILLRQGKLLKVRGDDAGLALTAPLGGVAIRITTGSLRSCTVFAGASVRRDGVGVFLARAASAPALADCSDGTLLTALGFTCADSFPTCGGSCPGDGVCAPDVLGGPCRCVFPTQPCGETAPLCGGECPAGEQCYPLDNFIPGPINGCGCAPIGEPPCGATGLACSATDCPGGLVCDLIPGSGIYESQCSCVDPNALCGQPGYGECPTDLECVFFPGTGGGWRCAPIFCGGTYPTCGSSCGGGRACVPFSVEGTLQTCVCATPGLSCDDGLTCDGGFSCPLGEVCTVTGSSCSCEPP